jgi:hypothetical protein
MAMTVPPVQLQPPGSGLPAFELAWLRTFFRMACSIMSQRIGLRWFKFESEKILALARRVPEGKGAIPVLINRIVGIEDSSRNWSAYMVLDHLRIVNEGITLIIDDLAHDRPFAQEVRIQDVKPRPDSGPDTIERFIQAVAAYEAAVARLGKLGRNMRHAHPWFGHMTAHDWHCLAAIHSWVHRRQMARIKLGLEHVQV